MKISSVRTALSFTDGNTKRVLKKPLNNTRCRKMRIKNIKYDIIIYLAFWALYAPLALLRWHHEKGNLIEISFILLIGLGIVLSGLLIYRYSHSVRWYRRRRPYIEIDDEPEEEPDDFEFEGAAAFRQLFSNGGVAT